MITIVPVAGLCNRMRTIASAAILARQVDRPLRVVWYRNPHVNARFDSIFRTDRTPFVVSDRWAMLGVVTQTVRGAEAVWKFLGGAVISQSEATPDGFDFNLAASLAKRGNLYIRSLSKFMSEPGMFDIFTPVPEIERQLERMSEALSRSVAVHIRRTDNVKSTQNSPMTAFFHLMDQEIAEDPGVRFFVATDSPEAFADLVVRYGDRVFEYKKVSLQRDNPKAITDAVVDLYALSRCRKLIGSYWSSFTGTAADLRGIERVIARAS